MTMHARRAAWLMAAAVIGAHGADAADLQESVGVNARSPAADPNTFVTVDATERFFIDGTTQAHVRLTVGDVQLIMCGSTDIPGDPDLVQMPASARRASAVLDDVVAELTCDVGSVTSASLECEHDDRLYIDTAGRTLTILEGVRTRHRSRERVASVTCRAEINGVIYEDVHDGFTTRRVEGD
jgi:hypothetical protein